MIKATAADVLVDSLLDWNLDQILGISGDGIKRHYRAAANAARS
ncbi:hypothetical protein [Mesorhizobium sp. WSM2239]|uniref:Uncharacterized protein n=2 Tax=unclassified Mesorhizobium TaxID=325217 RepID=A0AAU8D365_9HYPH